MSDRPERLKPGVTVLLAVHDGEPYLGEAIDSVLAQSYRELELLVVDDGSRDATPGILREAAARDPRLRIETLPRNQGLIHALNHGLGLAAGALVARLDADDRALPERLALQVEYLDRHPDVAVLGGAAIWMGRDPDRRMRRPLAPDAVRAALEENRPALIHPTVMFRRDAIRALGGYRPVALHAEDYDLWLRVAEHHQLANLEAPLIEYRIHEGQVSLTGREQQVLTALGAQESARRRRGGQPDPLDRLDRIDRAALRAMGVADDAVDAALLRSFNGWIHQLLDLGLQETAERVGRELARRPESRAVRGRPRAEASLAQARLCRARGDALGASLHTLRACLRSPGLLLRAWPARRARSA